MTKFATKKTFTVVVQKWEESEQGWGTRPDGYSIHIDEVSRKNFVKNYWSKMPKEVQEEYSRTSGSTYLADVDEEVYGQLKKSNSHGLRFYNNDYPGNGGSGGWHKVV